LYNKYIKLFILYNFICVIQMNTREREIKKKFMY